MRINFRISRASYLFQYWIERRLVKAGMDQYLKPGMGPVLFALFNRDVVPMGDLVRRTGLVPSTISRTVKAMTQSGVVSTRRDPKDARSVIVTLTQLGRSLEPRCNQMADEIDEILVRGLNKAQIQALEKGLVQVITNLNQAAED